MKTTIRKTIGLLAMAIVLTSCTKGEGINPEGGGSDELFLVTEVKTNGVTTGRYKFDSRNRMTAFHSYDNGGTHATTVTYTYDEYDRVLLVTNMLADETIVSTVEHTYAGNDDKPISAVTTNHAGDVVRWNITYSYSNNQLVETISPPAPVPETIITYTYNDNGDLFSIETNLGRIWGGTTEYDDYDSKKSPSLLGNPYAWKVPSKHNFRSVKTTQDSGVTQDQLYKYSYNDAGYPVKTEIYDKASDSLVETLEYSYIPAN